EHHGTEIARLLDRRDERAHGMVLEDDLVDGALDALALVGAERLWMSEVEAQLVRADGGARLLDVLAEDVPQRLVQDVRRRVVGHRREAHRPWHDRAHAHPLAKPFAAEGENLVVFEARRLDELRPRAGLLVLD